MNETVTDPNVIVASWSVPRTRAELAKSGVRLSLNRNRFNRVGIRDILLETIADPMQRENIVRLYDAHAEYYNEVCAGASWHHTDVGGLAQHVREMIGWSLDQLELYPADWEGVKSDDVTIGCFLHDFAKIWFYKRLSQEDLDKAKERGKPYREGQKFRGESHPRLALLPDEFLLTQELAKFSIKLTDMQLSSVIFAEGGFSDYVTGIFGNPTYTGDMVFHKNKLAVLVHMADLWSSQVIGGGLR